MTFKNAAAGHTLLLEMSPVHIICTRYIHILEKVTFCETEVDNVIW